jgi:hypothetical protein
MHVNQPIGGAADDNHRGHRPEHKYGYYGHDPLLRFPTVEQRIVLALVPVSQREKPQSRAVTRIAALRNESLDVRPRLLLGSGFSGRVSSAGIGEPGFSRDSRRSPALCWRILKVDFVPRDGMGSKNHFKTLDPYAFRENDAFPPGSELGGSQGVWVG